MKKPLNVFIVVGEHSGDQLGFKLMRALKARLGEAGVRFRGVGGEAMEAKGLKSLFPLHDIAVMGILPVIRRLPTLLARIKTTVGAVIGEPARCAGDHRQPRFHPPGGRAGAARPARSAGRRLCEPERLGLAARPRPQNAGLCR
jgi:hypothetical protein